MCLFEKEKHDTFIKEAHMNSIADGSVIIQTSSKSVFSRPSWFGEATLIVEHLRKQGVLSAIRERVRFTRRRFGRDVVIREASTRVVFDIDGTREAARQRALPQTEDLPAASRRLDDVCAPGYTGRKRGEVVRTRTVVSQAHS
jgi:hypothetical protein